MNRLREEGRDQGETYQYDHFALGIDCQFGGSVGFIWKGKVHQ